jgi:hypothetical protein
MNADRRTANQRTISDRRSAICASAGVGFGALDPSGEEGQGVRIVLRRPSRSSDRSSMELILRIGHVWSFDDLPPDTIALDGAVNGPAIDAERRRFSFDHHAGCIRLITSPTCQQVLDAILLGLDPSDCTVLVNDVDRDVVLAVWLLQHHALCRDPEALARVRPLVASVGGTDAHGPAYPPPDPALAEHFYQTVLAPVTRNRPSPGRDPEALATLDACLQRLTAWWDAGLVPAATIPPPEALPRLTPHDGWVLADAGEPVPGRHGAGADWLYQQGYDRAVLCERLPGGRFRYTLLKRSDLVTGFPLPDLYAALSAAEAAARGAVLGDADRWSGGSSIGGSPRDGGSVLPPEAVAAVIEGVMRAKATGVALRTTVVLG